MGQIALPLSNGAARAPARIVLGAANVSVAAALREPATWPFKTAVLTGPARSGKSLFADWFDQSGGGVALDDADRMDETSLFHRWNRAQEEGEALLIVAGLQPWTIGLPDLASRLGAALQLEIDPPDDTLLAELILEHAAARHLALNEEATRYLIPRMPRSFAAAERIVAEIDRISLERKAAPGMGVWRAALETVAGPEAPRLL